MSTPDEDRAKELADAISALGEVFISRIPAAMAAMETELAHIQNNAQEQVPWKTLHRHLHSMAGSAGTFGYDELGDRARELEDQINTILKDNIETATQTHLEFIRAQRTFMDWVNANYIKTFG
jgi:HPt (histidine-containing phosphotransfer) domain-containing protein